MHHKLKIWPQFFAAVRRGDKRFELREVRDRVFQVGDLLTLREFDPVDDAYTGLSVSGQITYVTHDFVGLKPGYCAFGFKLNGEGRGV